MTDKKSLTEYDVVKILSIFDSVIGENDWSKWQELQNEYGDYTMDEITKLVEDYKNSH